MGMWRAGVVFVVDSLPSGENVLTVYMTFYYNSFLFTRLYKGLLSKQHRCKSWLYINPSPPPPRWLVMRLWVLLLLIYLLGFRFSLTELLMAGTFWTFLSAFPSTADYCCWRKMRSHFHLPCLFFPPVIRLSIQVSLVVREASAGMLLASCVWRGPQLSGRMSEDPKWGAWLPRCQALP